MFKSSENLRLAAEMRALQRVAAPWREARRTWFDGTPESIEARLAATDRVLTQARAGFTAAHLSLTAEAEAARRELLAAKHRLLTDFLDDGARAFKGSKRVAGEVSDFFDDGYRVVPDEEETNFHYDPDDYDDHIQLKKREGSRRVAVGNGTPAPTGEGLSGMDEFNLNEIGALGLPGGPSPSTAQQWINQGVTHPLGPHTGSYSDSDPWEDEGEFPDMRHWDDSDDDPDPSDPRLRGASRTAGAHDAHPDGASLPGGDWYQQQPSKFEAPPDGKHGLPFERYTDPRTLNGDTWENHGNPYSHAVPELEGRHREDGPEMRREVGRNPVNPPGRHRPEFTPADIDAHQRWVEDHTWSPEKDDGNGGIRPDWRTAGYPLGY